jgi:hypothetical protein
MMVPSVSVMASAAVRFGGTGIGSEPDRHRAIGHGYILNLDLVRRARRYRKMSPTMISALNCVSRPLAMIVWIASM